ncbi:MAG: type II toxin-antitoxin system VapC family toxin [Acidobacteria bacterium]|nr:type II toxin-antitoxin system VapC family toxin [Acidobacteriota bacterium]
MTLLLDTHVLLWWLADADELSRAQVQALEQAESRQETISIAAISLWEIAKLAERGRLRLTQSVDVVLSEIEEHRGLHVVPLTARIALESTRLGARVPSDPADQLIVATARVHALRLVTADDRIRRAGAVSVI